MTPTHCLQLAAREPLYDINALTGISIEVFYADRTLETFGIGGAGHKRGYSPDDSPTAVRNKTRGVSPRDDAMFATDLLMTQDGAALNKRYSNGDPMKNFRTLLPHCFRSHKPWKQSRSVGEKK